MDILCFCVDLFIAIVLLRFVYRIIRGICISIYNSIEDHLLKREIKKMTKALRKRKFVEIKNTGEIVSTKNWIFVPERSNIYK